MKCILFALFPICLLHFFFIVRSVISNIGYVLLGGLFLLLVRVQDTNADDDSSSSYSRSNSISEEATTKTAPTSINVSVGSTVASPSSYAPASSSPPPALGLHCDNSLYYALGWAIVFEGIFSALYHVSVALQICKFCVFISLTRCAVLLRFVPRASIFSSVSSSSFFVCCFDSVLFNFCVFHLVQTPLS